MQKRIVAVLGSYRKDGIIHQTVDALLEEAKTKGASVEKIDLLDKRIKFCKNCRYCTQKDPDRPRGKCVQKDDMSRILNKLDLADGIVLASPINMFTVTALMKRFLERLTVYAYWPWGSKSPKSRKPVKIKSAVVLTSSAAPAPVARLFFGSGIKLLKTMAKSLGAGSVKSLHFGMVAVRRDMKLTEKQLQKARRMAI